MAGRREEARGPGLCRSFHEWIGLGHKRKVTIAMPHDLDNSDNCETYNDYNNLGSCGNPETVADLEAYGLSVKVIELLDRHDCIYIADLERLSNMEFLSWENAGPRTLEEIRAALRNHQAGWVVKTVRECVEIQKRGKAGGH